MGLGLALMGIGVISPLEKGQIFADDGNFCKLHPPESWNEINFDGEAALFLRSFVPRSRRQTRTALVSRNTTSRENRSSVDNVPPLPCSTFSPRLIFYSSLNPPRLSAPSPFTFLSSNMSSPSIFLQLAALRLSWSPSASHSSPSLLSSPRRSTSPLYHRQFFSSRSTPGTSSAAASPSSLKASSSPRRVASSIAFELSGLPPARLPFLFALFSFPFFATPTSRCSTLVR